jgi:glycosyltransferase involved in cell wall biosynthesis
MTASEGQASDAPLLSVAVTSYNYAAFLPCALDSVLSQSFTDFELIVIDNASTDESPAILREYAASDERIRLVLHEENQGALASLRETCDVALGTYLVHVDADDWVLAPTAFEEQIELLEANPQVSFVYSSLTMIGPEGETILVSRPYQRDVVVPAEEALEVVLGFNLSSSGMMFRLDAYRRTGGWPDENIHVADQQLASRLCEVGDVAYFDRPMYAFRQQGRNLHLESELKVVSNEVLPMIEAAFDGPLGRRIPDSSKVRRRVIRNALVHRPTQYIFSGELAQGWRLYWESVRASPILTIVQPRTLSLLSRTFLGQRGHQWLLEATGRG